jgi:hypothetical protein
MPKFLRLLALIAVLAGCSAAPAPNPDAPILTGFEALPKVIATVAVSPTPDAPEIAAIAASATANVPTATAAMPTATSTPTPYPGIFMGAMTVPAGTIAARPAERGQLNSAPAVNVGGSSGVVGVVSGLMPTPAVSIDPGQPCPVQPAPELVNAANNPTVRQQLGCPTGQPFRTQVVFQSFQAGFMFWRDFGGKEIYALSTAAIQRAAPVDTFWRVADQWNESLPADDPSLVPPAGLAQPIRGFGYVWRSNEPIRTSLGWATSGEQPYEAVWQDFERGAMWTSATGAIIAIVPSGGVGGSTGTHFGELR